MGNITVASTTNSQDEVNQAAGYVAEQVEAEEKPAPDALVESEEQEQPPKQEEGEKLPKKYLKRLDKLTAEKSAAEREAAELRGRLAEVQARPPAAETKPVVEQKATTVEKPTPDKFTTYEEYVEALSDWKYETRRAKEVQDEEKQAIQAYQNEVSTAYNQRVEAAKEAHEDWLETVNQPIDLPSGAGEAIIELENGPEVAYYLGKHPEVCQAMLEMSPARAIAEVGKIAAKLTEPDKEEAALAKAGPDKQPIVSKAPPPLPTLKGHGTKSSLSIDELPYEEYRKIRDQEQKNRFRR